MSWILKSNVTHYFSRFLNLFKSTFNLCKLLVTAFIFLACACVGQLKAQSTQVQGTVRDASDNKPLPGVNIVLKGTTNGSFTNKNGHYSIQVSSLRDTLVFTFVGYKRKIVPIQGRSVINLSMSATVLSQKELVVIGYGSQNRETVTSSISTVKSGDFNSGQVSDPLELIEGKVAGLTISTPNAGDPNASTDFSLRGPATLQGNSQPLIVIDGVPGGDLQSVAPDDIASIDVLKGASAAAIYGSRAAAGVIIVTTKNGKQGKTKVNYSGSVSTELVAHKYDMLNAEQYKQLANANDIKVYDAGANTDWFDQVTKTPVSQSHNLSISGGNQTTTYFTSLSYRHLEGIDLISKRRFVNGVARINTKALDDKLDFKFKITSTYDNKYYGDYGGLAQSLKEYPTFPVKNPDGTYFQKPDFSYGLQWNPVASMEYNTNKYQEKKLTGYANAAYQILPSLNFSLSYSVRQEDYMSGYYSSSKDFFQQRNNVGGMASRSDEKATFQDVDAVLHYKKSLKHNNFQVTAGYSFNYKYDQGFGAGNNNFNTNAYGFNNLGAGTALNNLDPNAVRQAYVNSYASDRTLRAFFGRVLYNYKQRYLLNASVRRSGASVLGRDNKWGTFPGVSVGWRISSEQFMQNVDFVKGLKLRAGYGITGNQESLSPYQSLATIGSFYSGSHDGYFGEPGNVQWILPYGPTDNANPDLRWEKEKELDIGLDFKLFKNGLLDGSFDYYRRNTTNLVGNFSAQLPPEIFPSIFANAGNMLNKGFELTLNAHPIRSHNFLWNSTLTGSYNKNEIVSLSSDQYKGTAQDITYISEGTPIQRLAAGHPLAAFYGRVFAGFTNDGKNWLFKNSEGKAVEDSQIGENDYRYLGNSIPRYNLALTNSFKFWNFDLTLMLKSALDFNAVNTKKIYYDNITRLGRNNLFASATKDAVKAPPIFSSYYLENGNYVKVKKLTIGYTLPVKNLGVLRSFRVYVTGSNLATITGFSGQDPELRLNWVPLSSDSETSGGPGVESLNSYYPDTRNFQFGINIGL